MPRVYCVGNAHYQENASQKAQERQQRKITKKWRLNAFFAENLMTKIGYNVLLAKCGLTKPVPAFLRHLTHMNAIFV